VDPPLEENNSENRVKNGNIRRRGSFHVVTKKAGLYDPDATV